MASIKLKRLLGCLFICICSIFLMSHNVFAADLSVPVRLYSTSGYVSATYSDGNTTGPIVGPTISTNVDVRYSAISVFDGLYIDIPFYVYNYQENNGVDGYMNIDYIGCNYGNIACQLAGFNYSGSSSGQVYHAIIYVSGNGNLSSIQLSYQGTNGFALRLFEGERAQPLPLIAYRLMDTSTDMSNVNSYITQISNQLNQIYQKLGVMENNIPSADDIATAITEKEKQEAESAVNDANNSAESNTNQIQDATGDTQASVQGVIDVIFNTGATNCEINANLGKINLGNLNMCSAPSSILNIISAVSGIIGVIVTVNVGRKVIFDVQEIIMRVTNG